MKPKVCILGAGVTGLTAALHLLRTGRFEVELVEKKDRVGGLAASYTLGPATFDFGPHAFHSQQPHIIRYFRQIMQKDFYEIDKNVAIRFKGRLYSYPINPVQALRNMPLRTSLKCTASYFWNLLANHRSLENIQTAEEFFVRNFGWEMYRIFFEGYTQKVWGIHPKALSAAFIKNRMPSASLLAMAWAYLTGRDINIRKPHEIPLKLSIFYPKRGAIQFPQMMVREIERLGGKISLDCMFDSLDMEGGQVRRITVKEGSKLQSQECQAVISTIPLPELICAMRPLPAPEILASANQLKFRAVLIACLWINMPQIFPYQTIYYTNRIFNRLAQMNSYSPGVTPPGTCGVTAEVTCEIGDTLWNMEEKVLLDQVIAEMEIEGLISPGEVKEGMVLRTAHGYPVYHLGFEKHLVHLRKLVHEIPNLYTGGRQGMFNYAQMHYGVNSGMLTAERIAKGLPKPPVPEERMNEVEEAFLA